MQTGTVIAALRGHESPVYALAYSPDGKRLASGSADKTVRLWELAPGKTADVLRGHEKPVEWLSYSPDGQRICSLDGESGRLWDVTTGRAIAVLGGHARNFTALFLPDGKRLVIGLDRQVCLYDAATGRQVAVLGSHDHRIIRLAVSPEGRRIASHGEGEKHIRLWDGVHRPGSRHPPRPYSQPGGPGLQPRRVASGLGISLSGQQRAAVGRRDRAADRRPAGPH